MSMLIVHQLHEARDRVLLLKQKLEEARDRELPTFQPFLPEPDRLPTLRQHFEALHDGAHPLRIALDKLQTFDTIRFIEGEA